MSSALADTTEAGKYGSARGVREALKTYFAEKDPKGTKRRRQNSSNVRGQMGVVQQASDDLLVDELKRRLRVKRKRKQARERQARRRARLSR